MHAEFLSGQTKGPFLYGKIILKWIPNKYIARSGLNYSH